MALGAGQAEGRVLPYNTAVAVRVHICVLSIIFQGFVGGQHRHSIAAPRRYSWLLTAHCRPYGGAGPLAGTCDEWQCVQKAIMRRSRVSRQVVALVERGAAGDPCAPPKHVLARTIAVIPLIFRRAHPGTIALSHMHAVPVYQCVLVIKTCRQETGLPWNIILCNKYNTNKTQALVNSTH